MINNLALFLTPEVMCRYLFKLDILLICHLEVWGVTAFMSIIWYATQFLPRLGNVEERNKDITDKLLSHGSNYSMSPHSG